jgi:membrane protein DedA with SNARE-associated domain
VPDLGAYLRDLAIFFGAFVGAGLGLPFPEEILIVAAGIWTAAHPEYLGLQWLMLPVCIVGVIIADVLLYGVGRQFGVRLLRQRWMSRLLPPEKMLKIEDNFHRYGVGILLFGRLLPGIRAPLFITAGLMRLSIARFLVADGLGAVLGNSLLFFLGWWFGDAFMELVKRVGGKLEHVLGPVLIMSAVVAVVVWLTLRYLKRPVTTGDPEELPLIGHQVAVRLDHSEPHHTDKTGRARPTGVQPPSGTPPPPVGPTEQEGLSTGASATRDGEKGS